ncbi:hypothetical protein Ddye_012132 [Dipteronia dyeriana]|uniref:Uncharacterized protein n=1 Tax=Dipteronia dyeriana TaxID=168575 RepID=A0AAD9X3T2_9ROSI|nr:hypothetical protein Ddye_012132 [Dipteronia dyeriana]
MEKMRVMRDLVRTSKPNLLFIQESKLNYFDSRITKSLKGSFLTKGVDVKAKGSAMGVITLWDEGPWIIEEIFTLFLIIVKEMVVLEMYVIKDLEVELAKLEECAATSGCSIGLRDKRSSVLIKLRKQIRLDEQKWKQSSRVKWLKDGDGNSKYFHILSNVRREANSLGNIVISGNYCKGPTQVREGVLSFFKDHFKRKVGFRPRWDGLPINQISEHERLNLEVVFSVDEVWKALSDCDGNKAPGPDGLNLNFIKANWEMIKGDFTNFFHAFYSDRSVIKDFNCNFIALILNVMVLVSMQDHRPISLVGSCYNVLANVLANRLNVVKDYVIGPTQMAFVKDRQIINSFVFAGELAHLIYNIRHFMKNMPSVGIKYMPRESNYFTDSLAKAASSGGMTRMPNGYQTGVHQCRDFLKTWETFGSRRSCLREARTKEELNKRIPAWVANRDPDCGDGEFYPDQECCMEIEKYPHTEGWFTLSDFCTGCARVPTRVVPRALRMSILESTSHELCTGLYPCNEDGCSRV